MSAVTMRRVAEELDTGPASLYVYVANRDELLQAMYDAAMGEVPVPTVDPARWREQLKKLLRDSVTAMERYPGIARVALANVPGPAAPADIGEHRDFDEHTIEIAEVVLQLLVAGGVPRQSAAWATDLLALFITATAVESAIHAERGFSESSVPDAIRSLRTALAALSPQRYPLVSSMATELTIGNGDTRFEFGVEVLINGLLATPEPERPDDWLARG